MIKYNFERCYPCKMKNDKKITTTNNNDNDNDDNDDETQIEFDSEEEQIKKCIDCSKIIKPNFTRCYNCNDKHKNK